MTKYSILLAPFFRDSGSSSYPNVVFHSSGLLRQSTAVLLANRSTCSDDSPIMAQPPPPHPFQHNDRLMEERSCGGETAVLAYFAAAYLSFLMSNIVVDAL